MTTAGDAFKTAINTYSGDATSLFNLGHDVLAHAPPAIPPAPDNDASKQAKAYLGAGFAQLGSAAQMESTQLGREGYAAVVDLMKSTSITVQAICTRLQTIVATTPISGADYTVISALTEALKAIAQVTPTSVWANQTPAS